MGAVIDNTHCYPTNQSFDSTLSAKSGFEFLLLSILGIAGEYHSFNVSDRNHYSNDGTGQVRAITISMTPEEIENLGILLIKQAGLIKKERSLLNETK